MLKYKKSMEGICEKENYECQCCRSINSMGKSDSEGKLQDPANQMIKAFALGHSLGRMWF